MIRVADDPRDGRRMAARQPPRAFGNGLEHRLHVRRRAGDHLQDVGGRCLPLQRLLGLIEQPRILDRDDGLRREVLQLPGEGPDFPAIDRKGSQNDSVFAERHGQVGVGPGNVDQGATHRIAEPVALIVRGVGDVNEALAAHEATQSRLGT